jgi:hypothetical protein
MSSYAGKMEFNICLPVTGPSTSLHNRLGGAQENEPDL